MYEPADGGYIFWHAVLVNPTFVRAEKDEPEKNKEGAGRLTIESKPRGIDKGQVTLKKVQRLHKTPLRFPNEIDLHAEGNDVIPNKQRTRCDCGENQKN